MATPAGPGPAGGEPSTGGDGAIVGGPRTHQQVAAQRRLQQTQAQVDEVVDIMRTNVEKVLERDQKLSELDDRADALQQGASQFEQQAGKLKRKYWWKNLKMMIIMGVIGLIIIIIIGISIGTGGSSDSAPAAPVVTEAPHAEKLMMPQSLVKDPNMMDAGKDVLGMEPRKGEPILR